ncbi:MAG: SusC/RagA family TonB-linked outer membrane protein [Candidatus Cryptobacteroides sp.]
MNTRTFIFSMLLMFAFSLGLSAQSTSVRGTVLDNNGTPVIGAAVFEDGSRNGAVTDESGQFFLPLKSGDSRITVSSLGYRTFTLSVNKQDNLVITLEEDTNYLDEIVVVGYGTTTQRHIISSVSTVSQATLEDRPVANIQQALQGAAANLVIQTTSFDPNNTKMNLSIRGVGTIGNNTPLVVIDGVPQQGAGRMNDLNPSDIASISILKDAGSSAIYGARSSNGVILITTKTGKKEQTAQVKFSAQVGIQNPDILFEPIPTYLNSIYRNEALTNVGNNPVFTAADIRDMYEHGDSELLLKQAMKNGLQQSYSVSVSGGSKRSSYMISGRYFDQDSNFVGPGYGIKKYNLRSNLTTEIGNLKLGLNLGFTGVHSKSTVATTVIVDLSRYPTYWFYRVKDDNGIYYSNNYKYGKLNGNKIADLEKRGYNKNDNNFANASFTAEYKIIDGLKARAVLSGEIRNTHRFSDQGTYLIAADSGSNWADPSSAVVGGDTKTPADDAVGKDTYLNGQVMLDFNRVFKQKHNVTALLGWSQESNYSYGLSVKKSYLNDLNQPGEDTVIEASTSLSSQDNKRYALQSYFGRVGYSYDEKYYLEFIARYDMSSKFLKCRNAGFFPAVNAGWRISEEKFMSDWKYKVGEMKLRASYGMNGNQQDVGLYDFITKYSLGQNIYGFNDSSVPGMNFTIGNELLTWETSKTFNVGADVSFFKNSLNVSFDWFHKRTSNILLPTVVPGTFGASVGKENRGVMANQGWEITINYNLVKGDWQHLISFNIADSKNKVVKYGPRDINSVGGVNYLIEEGYPLNSYYGYKCDGLFQSYEEIQNSATPATLDKAKLAPGDVKYKDINNDGVINEDDRTYLGYAFPRYTFGLTYNVKWKGIDVGIILQGVLKRNFALRGEQVEPFHADYGYTMYTHQLDFWTPVNTDARWPRLAKSGSVSRANNWAQGSDLYVLNAAYMRVKNIQVGYTIPAKFTRKFRCENLRIYFDTQNPLTISKYGFVDPETSEFGANMNNGNAANSVRNYPTLRYFGGGVNVTF